VSDVHLRPLPWAIDPAKRYVPIRAATRPAHDQAVTERAAVFAALHEANAAAALRAARRKALRWGPLA
jgi:hypothetical protein